MCFRAYANRDDPYHPALMRRLTGSCLFASRLFTLDARAAETMENEHSTQYILT